MENKLLKGLQKFFWVMGWLSLVGVGLGVAMVMYNHFFPLKYTTGGVYRPDFSDLFAVLVYIRNVFGGIAAAFFAFLMSTVFGMIIHRQPYDHERSEKFLKIACGAYVLESLLAVINQLHFVWVADLGCSVGQECDTLWQVTSHMTVVMGFFVGLSPLLYAISIYVLFRHFSKMIQFESEVV